MLRLLRSVVNVKKRKEICVSFAVKPQTAKVMATECSKWLLLLLLLLLLSHFSRVRLCATHRRQPTKLPSPWDSPGNNTGVGCHFLLQCMKVKSESEVAQSCIHLQF